MEGGNFMKETLGAKLLNYPFFICHLCGPVCRPRVYQPWERGSGIQKQGWVFATRVTVRLTEHIAYT